MKKQTFILIAIFCFATAFAAKKMIIKNGEQKIWECEIPENDTLKIEFEKGEFSDLEKLNGLKLSDFFARKLSGENVNFSESAEFELKDFPAQKTAVWEAWRKANDDFKEEKLLPLSALNRNEIGVLNLPENSEPNRKMEYFYGYKGDETPYGRGFCVYLHGGVGEEDTREWEGGFDWAKFIFGGNYVAYFVPKMPCSNPTDFNRWYLKAKLPIYEKLFRYVLSQEKSVFNHNIFFAGASEGGYGSQRIAAFYADYLSGAAPMAAGEPLKNAPAENCANILFTLTTGSEDFGFGRKKLTEKAMNEFARLQNENPGYYNHEISLQEGKAHTGIDYTKHLYSVKNAQRKATPKYVYWKNFPMDGIYRKGFYNLQELVSSHNSANDEVRTCYEEKIEGQTIFLTVKNVTYSETDEKYDNSVVLQYDKKYETATSGKVRVWLSPDLVDLSQNVKIELNGKVVFDEIPTLDFKNLAESCALFFDPERVFPAAVDLEIKDFSTPE